ncbi:MAG: stage III sporulation protein AE [Clostridia bacterium]
MRTLFAITMFLLLILPCTTTRAEQAETPDMSVEDGVNNWMNNVDWSGLEQLLAGMPEDVRTLWGTFGVRQRTEELALSGSVEDVKEDALLSMLSRMLRAEWQRLASLAATLIGLTLAGGLSMALSGGKSGGAQETAAFVCRCFTLTVVLSAFSSSAAVAVLCMRSLCACMEIAMPILMTLLTAIGGVSTVGVFQPSMALLTNGVAAAMLTVVVPLALCGGVLGLFDQLSERIRLGELGDCIRSGIKWVIGIVTTLYVGTTALRGMTAAARDGVTIRTAKYAAGSMLPMVGGLVNGSFDTMLGCAGLVKNAAGMTMILLCVSIVLTPLFRITASMLLLRLTAAVTQPIAEKKQTGMFKIGADMLAVLLSACAAVAAMFLVTIGLIVGLGNAGYIG